MQRQDVNGEGYIKAKIIYKISAVLYQWQDSNNYNADQEKELAKFSSRFFIAKVPEAPR